MKFLYVLAALTVLVKAQMENIAQIPPCALGCIGQALPSTDCTLMDVDCICASTQLWTEVERCALATCSAKDALTSRRIAAETCNEPVRDRTQILAYVAPIMCGVALLLLVFRILARLSGLNGMLGADDGVIIGAFATGAPIAPLAVLLTKYGLGRDVWMVPFADITKMLRIFYICQLLYIASTNLAKIALLLFFIRVFPQHKFRRLCYGMIAFVVAYMIAMMFPTAFQCRPVSFTWTQWDGEHQGSCNNIYAGTWAAAATNMVIDLVILVFPLPMLRKLHITRSWKKVQIFLMFSIGLIITIVSALRLRALVIYGQTNNITWEFSDAGMWSAIECYTAIMCACLPAARIFFTTTAPKWLGISSYLTDSRTSRKTPGSGQDVVRAQGRAPKLSAVPHATTMAMSFPDRSTEGFSELEDNDIELPIQGPKRGRPEVIREVDEAKSWNSLERVESGYSPPASTKQWS